MTSKERGRIGLGNTNQYPVDNKNLCCPSLKSVTLDNWSVQLTRGVYEQLENLSIDEYVVSDHCPTKQKRFRNCLFKTQIFERS